MSRRFLTLDVFTTTPMTGNPLAVVLDAEGLDDASMQRIAREFNLSETVFVRPPQDAAHRAALRIFTPGRELPFAGHPTVGTAVLLALLDRAGETGALTFALEEKVGLVPCSATVTGESSGHATFALPRLPALIEPAATDAALAASLGLDPQEIGFEQHRPGVYSAGVGFTIVPVRDLDTVARAKPVMVHWDATIRPMSHANAFVYCRQTREEGHHFHARMFAPDLGIGEDPATGSAVAAFAGAIVAADQPADGEHVFLIEQGYEMGRPSLIRLELTMKNGLLQEARIGGHAVVVSEGRLKV